MEVDPLNISVKRNRTNKRWTDVEVKIILNYLQGAPEIEAPTAQIFYTKLIAVTGINASWNIIRFKVRHLKALFKKANYLKSSTARSQADKGVSSVEGHVLQICPHYYQLREIFGEMRSTKFEYDVNGTGSSEEFESNNFFSMCSGDDYDFAKTDVEEYSFAGVVDKGRDVECSISKLPAGTSTHAKHAQSIPSSAPPKGGKLKKFGPKSSSAFQAYREKIFQRNLEWEKEKFERKFLFKEKKLKYDNEYRNKKLDLKKLEMKKDERLKILQMEKEERVERYALELKWKHNEIQ